MVAVAAQIAILRRSLVCRSEGTLGAGIAARTPVCLADRQAQTQKSSRCFGFRTRIASGITADIIVRRRSFEALREEVAVRTIGLVRRREDVERVKQGGCEIVV